MRPSTVDRRPSTSSSRDQLLQLAVEEYGKARAHEMAVWLTFGIRPFAQLLLEAEAALAKVEAARARIFEIVNDCGAANDAQGDPAIHPPSGVLKQSCASNDVARNRRSALRLSDLSRVVSIAMAGACAANGTVARARGSQAPAATSSSAIDRRPSTVDGATEGSAHGTNP